MRDAGFMMLLTTSHLIRTKRHRDGYQGVVEIIPIPSISDCLEKLRGRDEWIPDYYNKKHFNRSLLNIFKNYIEGKFTVIKVHYWLLSALLEILKEAK